MVKKISKIAALSAVVIITIVLINNYGIAPEPVKKTPLPEIDLTKFNHFEQKEGLFSFDYKNNFEVIQNKEVYFLRELETGNTAFQIFENNSKLTFNKDNYTCEQPKKKSEICYSTQSPLDIITNIQIHPEQKNPDRKYRILTRAETLKIIFDLRYPEIDFEKERDNCFRDVDRLHPLSGYICYAKKIGTIVGIDESFYPESSVNLWGYLKILFTTFEVDDFDTKHSIRNKKIFDLMTKHHLAYELIRKAYYEGLFNNVIDSDIWPNRHVYMDEAVQIATNFFQWQKGKKIRDYKTSQGFNLQTYIQKENPFLEFTFVEVNPESFENETENRLFGNDLYFRQPGNVWEYIYSFKNIDNIANIRLSYDPDEFKGKMLISYTDGLERHFELTIQNDQFAYLTTNVQNSINDPNVLPNPARTPDSHLPHISITLDHEDFKSILINRTITKHYPAYLTMTYQDGSQQEGSILIKTRGNASRGYIKSSYTIEAFEDFKENPSFIGDEFLENADKIKLRSMISDDSMIKEKLIYKTFRDLGNIAPDFFDATVDINGIPFGLFQVTEEVDKNFFKNHGVEVENYYYAQNVTSKYLANLTIFDDTEVYETHYKTKGSSKKLLTFITDLKNNDKGIYEDIDIQNIFDYTFLTYITAANDSITHNYYLYFDETEQKWGMSLWDADAGFQFTPYINKAALKKYGLASAGTYNRLIEYVFRNISTKKFNELYADFIKRWNENVDLVGQTEMYLRDYKELFLFDNKLWNGLHLERKVPYFDTILAIIDLREKTKEIEKSLK